MNVEKRNLDKIIRKLPALKRPTISYLNMKDWYALEVIVSESEIKRLIPSLKSLGAEDIIEYPLNKVVY